MIDTLKNKIHKLYSNMNKTVEEQKRVMLYGLETSKSSLLSQKDILKDIKELQTLNNRTRNYLQELNSLIPISHNIITSEKADMRIYYDNGLYFFDLNEPIPSQLKVNLSAEDVSYDVDRNVYYSRYRNVIEEYERNIGFHLFSGKIAVYVLNKSPENEVVRDADNLELKPFIDAAINKILTKDDNMSCMSLIIDHAYYSRKMTTVVVGKERDVFEYIIKTKEKD